MESGTRCVKMRQRCQTRPSLSFGYSKKAVHLVRDPFDNVVSRYHNHQQNGGSAQKTKTTTAGNETEAFRVHCFSHNARLDTTATLQHFLTSEQFKLIENVPCRT